MRLLGQVRDHRSDVRQPLEAEKGRATLEVDQYQVERLGRMGGDHPQGQRAQELRLARTRRPDAEPVRSGATMCGLLDVQLDGVTLVVDTDRDP